MRPIRFAALLLVFLAVSWSTPVPPATAQNPTQPACVVETVLYKPPAWHCVVFYEFEWAGQAHPQFAFETCAVSGGFPCTLMFADGNFEAGGVSFDGCYSSRHMNNTLISGQEKSHNLDWPSCNMPTGTPWSQVEIQIIDNTFGSDIGGFVCLDLDEDRDCGTFDGVWEACRVRSRLSELGMDLDECGSKNGEGGEGFCSVWTIKLPNYATSLVFLVDGPGWQPVDCPGTANPVGATSGEIHVWIYPTTSVPSCADGIDIDSDGYRDFGHGPNWPELRGSAVPGGIGDGCWNLLDNTE